MVAFAIFSVAVNVGHIAANAGAVKENTRVVISVTAVNFLSFSDKAVNIKREK